MRVAHTSDWHAGRIFRQLARLPELQSVLENLGDDLEREKVELLLMSGDVFDSGAPSAEAERAVFSFFKRVGRAGVRTVVIGGNHDSPARLEAWGGLAELVDVTVVAKPLPADAGGLLRIDTRSGERALVAAVPFAAPRFFVSALELGEGRVDQRTGQRLLGDVVAKQDYAESLAEIVRNVTEPFRGERGAVTLLMLHTHMVGAVFSGSERQVHLGDEWAAAPQALPASAQYVALGHIHKPQSMPAAPGPAEYAGSPLQMDFGECGESKSFVLLDVRPGQPARIERVPYRGARRLERVRLDLGTLEQRAEMLRNEPAYLWVTVPLEAPDPELNGRVRRLLPNAVKVEPELPAAPATAATRPPAGTPPREMFAAYYRAQGREPAAELLAAFDDLLHQAEAAS